MDSKDLLKSQLEQIPAGRAKKIKAVRLPVDIGEAYKSQIDKMIRELNQSIKSELVQYIKSIAFEYTADAVSVNDEWPETIQDKINALREQWSGEQFDIWAQNTASKFVYAADIYANGRLKKTLSPFGINVYDNPTISTYLSASITENVALIKSIPEQHLSRVESIVLSNMRAGLRPSSIEDEIQHQFGVTKRRARTIARDQTSKVVNGVSQRRMKAAGVAYFKWHHVDDNRVRSRHRAIANKVTKYGKGIYSFSDLPIGDDGVPIAPGDAINCRCVAIPVLQSEIDSNIKKGLVNKGVKK
jgi:SPP1 gp7 family putative phage head morphogenesis protein